MNRLHHTLWVCAFWFAFPSLECVSNGALEGGRARACTYPPPGVHVWDAPADGVVLVSRSCGRATCDVAAGFSLVDDVTGAPVEGEVRYTRESYAVFAPDAPLTPGQTYRYAGPGGGAGPVTLMALEPATVDVSRAALSTVVRWTTRPLSYATCTQPSTCGGFTETIAASTETVPEIRIRISNPGWLGPPMIPDGQVVSRVAFWREGDPEPPLSEATWMPRIDLRHAFDARADGYCYRLSLESLIDGQTAEFAGCLPHGNLGERTVVETPMALFRLASCMDVPTDFVDIWCQLISARCMGVDDGPRGGCANFRAHCPAASDEPMPGSEPPRPDPPTPSTAGGAAAGGAAPAPATPAGAGTPARSSESCAVTAAERGAPGSLALIALALALVARHRRDRR